MSILWEKFIKDKKYLKRISSKTISDYECAWNAWKRFLPEDPKQIDANVVNAVKIGLQEMRVPSKRRPVTMVPLSIISVNSYLKVFRTFVRWLNIRDGNGDPVPVELIIQPKLVPRTFTEEQLEKILTARTECMEAMRVQLLAKIYLDTGARAEEILGLRREDVNLDDCLIKLEGKGARERVVPFSPGLRPDLYRWMERYPNAEWLFPTLSGRRLTYDNALKNFKTLAAKVGVVGKRVSFHTLRHTMATGYIAEGGNVLHLSRLLGHASVKMTEKYVHMQTKDLSKVHYRFSLLGKVMERRGRR